ncbi:uncharacterized protein [Triticum aestivum]|uniref:uncharacterized protein isoform X1 n=1 Tax=Triticum aestivum TaxID=4565 RepID=UPI001D01D1C0|nr:uncharacterized protein LOC123165390 isoform X1 [Triticum aestivum]
MRHLLLLKPKLAFLLKSRKSSSSAGQTALSCSTTVAAFSGSTTAATNASAPRLPRPARRSTGTGDAAAAARSARRGGPADAVAALAGEGEFKLPGDFNFIFICRSGAYDSLDSGGNITIKCGVNGLKILSDYPPFILQPDWQILLNMFRCRNWNKGKHHMLRPD